MLDCVRRDVSDIPSIVTELYAGVPEGLHQAAGRSVLAHLVKLVDDGLVVCDGPPSGEATFVV